MGLRQQGRSRTWLDDQGVWLGVVEFQPSSWSRGSYPNVGASWLWNARRALAPDLGHRAHCGGDTDEYVAFVSVEQFAPHARRLAERAAKECASYRTMFPDIGSIARALRDTELPAVRQFFNAGVAFGLAGEPEDAKASFGRYLAQIEALTSSDGPSDDWSKERTRVIALIELTDHPARFARQINGDIARSRELLKLPPIAARWQPRTT
jgi:hypothetical protein